MCQDQKSRNDIINGMKSYQIWKQATKNISSVQVGNQIMSGEEVLTKTR